LPSAALATIIGLVTLSADGWEWPDSLDAVVAAPEHHSVLLENDRVRVLAARVEAGDTVSAHTHRWPGVQYVVSTADFVRRDGDGEVLVDSRAMDFPRERPLVLWSEPLPPHTLENVGDDLIHVIVVELKGPPVARKSPPSL
jgi:hypothetical protein